MSIKILLDASALRALHEIHPDATLELARNSAAAVGREIAKTAASDTIRHYLLAAIDDIVKTKYHGIISSEAKQLISKAIREQVDAAFDMKTIPDLLTRMRQNAIGILDHEWETRKKSLANEIDDLLRERFSAMFAVKQN